MTVLHIEQALNLIPKYENNTLTTQEKEIFIRGLSEAKSEFIREIDENITYISVAYDIFFTKMFHYTVDEDSKPNKYILNIFILAIDKTINNVRNNISVCGGEKKNECISDGR